MLYVVRRILQDKLIGTSTVMFSYIYQSNKLALVRKLT